MTKLTHCIVVLTVITFWLVSNVAFSETGATFITNISWSDIVIGVLVFVLAIGAAGGLVKTRKD
jgi:cell division protein FtsX